MADGGISAIAIASLALTAIGTGVAVAGSMAQADAAEKASEYNAKVGENNAKAAQDQANFQAQQIRDRGRRILGSQTAAASASGISLSGSFLDVQHDTLANNELDALAAEYQGGVSANKSLAQSQLDRMQGRNAKEAGYWGAGSSLLTGLSHGLSIGSDLGNPGYRPPSVKAQPVANSEVPGFY